jgi:hypothetical protein
MIGYRKTRIVRFSGKSWKVAGNPNLKAHCTDNTRLNVLLRDNLSRITYVEFNEYIRSIMYSVTNDYLSLEAMIG